MKVSRTRKILSIILAAALIFGALPVFALPSFAADVNDLDFILNYSQDGYILHGCDKSARGELIIPSEYKGLPVVEIEDRALYNCVYLTSVTIPETVKKIGYGAFASSTSLEEINVDKSNTSFKSIDGVLFETGSLVVLHSFPAGHSTKDYAIPEICTAVYANAFLGCEELTSLKVHAGVRNIDATAFSDCTKLEAIYVDEGSLEYSSDDNGILYNADKTALYECTEGNTVESLEIPGSVTSIRYDAFENNTHIKSVVIPESVTNVGVDVFYGCTSLTSVEIPGSLKEIGTGMFKKCSSLKSVVIPDGVTRICTGAFEFCTGLESVKISNTVTDMGVSAFSGCTSLRSVEIPDGVTEISSAAFSGCTSLKAVEIPDGVTEISSTAFSGCTSLTAVVIPEGVTKLSWGAFLGCTGLTSVTIPSSLPKIDDYVFAECTSLAAVEIPEGVTEIVSDAFYCCSSLKLVTIPESVTTIGEKAFGYGESYYDSKRGERVYPKVEDFTLCGVQGSAAQKYAVDNGFVFVTVTGEVTDSTGISVAGSLSEGTVLEVKELEATEDGYSFDITLKKGGEAVQPDGKLVVKIPVPEALAGSACKVFRKEANGSYTDMKAVFDGESFIFVTDHFSEYIITTKDLGVVYGDANGDGKVDLKDVVLLRQYMANYVYETETSSVEVKPGADADGDGKVDLKDVVLLRQYMANYSYDTESSTVVLGPQ